MFISVLFLLTLLPTITTAKEPEQPCKPGLTGENCEEDCPFSCNTCDRVSQDCTGFCKQQHHFGKRCQDICPKFCDGTCNLTTGSCFRCSPSFTGTFCNISCPKNCRSTCDINTMECHQCKQSFTGKYCSGTCPSGCSDCNQFNGTCLMSCPNKTNYGEDCKDNCPQNCRDGCYRDTGECVKCAEGFGGRFCNGLCSDNCLTRCDRFTGTCNDCIVGYSGGKCLENCPANCKGKCDQKTGYCVECTSGYQGKKCNAKCPEKCNGDCHQTTGVCKSCFGQFCEDPCEENCRDACDQTTRKCTKCRVGFTGVFCNHTCSRYCRDECEQTSGECIGCIDGYTGRFCTFATGKKLLKGVCGALGAALMVLGLTLIIVVKRRRHTTLQNRRTRLDSIPEANDDRESNSTGHKYSEIVDDNLINNSEMVTARGNNLPHQNVNLPPPLPSQRILQRGPPSQQDANLRLSTPLPSQRNLPLIPITQQDLELWSPCPSPCQQVQAKTSRPQTSGPLSTSGSDFYLDAIFESSINSASTFTGHSYYNVNKDNLVKDSRRVVTSKSDGCLPVLLQSPQSPLPEQDIDIQLRPLFVGQHDLPAIQQDICLPLPPPLPRQREPSDHSPVQQDVDLEFHTSLPYQQNKVKSPRPKRVNYHFDCDVIFENAIYESADEFQFPNKEIVLPMTEDKDEQILPEVEPEHLKHPVAVGGAPAPAYPDVEAPAVPAINN